MAEEIILKNTSKQGIYEELLPQISALVKDESDFIANIANISAALKQAFGFLWVGFYLVKEQELVLGPFQGPIACTRIKKGKGVCGTAWQKSETIIVPDVDKFPGHIACSSLSKSEIVLPLLNTTGQVVGVMDVDSDQLNAFDDIDLDYLSKIILLIKTDY